MSLKRIFSLFIIMFFLTSPMFVLAACDSFKTEKDCERSVSCTWDGNACVEYSSGIDWKGEPFYTTIQNVTEFFNIMGGVIIGLFIILGGFLYASGGGNEKQLSTAKSMITCAIIGLVIISFANVIVSIVQRVIS